MLTVLLPVMSRHGNPTWVGIHRTMTGANALRQLALLLVLSIKLSRKQKQLQRECLLYTPEVS